MGSKLAPQHWLFGLGILSLGAWVSTPVQAEPLPSFLRSGLQGDPVFNLAQALSAPQLDDSLRDLQMTFTQIAAIQLPDVAASAPGYTILNPTGYGASV